MAVEALPVGSSGSQGTQIRGTVQELAAAKIGDIGKEAAPAVEELGRALVESEGTEGARATPPSRWQQCGPPSRKEALPDLIIGVEGFRRRFEVGPIIQCRPALSTEAIDNIRLSWHPRPPFPPSFKVIQSDPNRQVTRACGRRLLPLGVRYPDRSAVTPVLAGVLEETEPRKSTVPRYESRLCSGGEV